MSRTQAGVFVCCPTKIYTLSICVRRTTGGLYEATQLPDVSFIPHLLLEEYRLPGYTRASYKRVWSGIYAKAQDGAAYESCYSQSLLCTLVWAAACVEHTHPVRRDRSILDRRPVTASRLLFEVEACARVFPRPSR